MPTIINGVKFYRASEVAALAGVHRLTLLRWIKEERLTDVARDRNNWRVFSEDQLRQIVEYAQSINNSTSPRQGVLFSRDML